MNQAIEEKDIEYPDYLEGFYYCMKNISRKKTATSDSQARELDRVFCLTSPKREQAFVDWAFRHGVNG